VFLMMSVKQMVKAMEMASPRIATWCLCLDAWVTELYSVRMRMGTRTA